MSEFEQEFKDKLRSVMSESGKTRNMIITDAFKIREVVLKELKKKNLVSISGYSFWVGRSTTLDNPTKEVPHFYFGNDEKRNYIFTLDRGEWWAKIEPLIKKLELPRPKKDGSL